MIRIERGQEVSPGIWEYTVPSLSLCGRSRQPLLDACRQIRSTGADPAYNAGLFRGQSTTPDMTCPVGLGATYTVSETATRRPTFIIYREFTGIPDRG